MVVAYRFPPSEMEPVLVARARAGDDEAFSELMGEYGETVRRLVRRFVTDSDDASDVEQETWIRAFSKLDSLRDVHRFRPWLKSIARNSALTFVSGRSKQGAHVRMFHTYEDDEVEEFEDLSEPTPEAYTLSRDNRRKICEALGSLSQTDRDVLDMRERLRLDYDEIATRLGISRNAAEVRACRARDRFRQIFDLVEDKQSRCGTNPLLISELIDAELDEATARDVRAHIKSCHECDERFVTMQAGQAVYRNWGGLAMPGLTGGGLLGFLAEATQRVLTFLGLGGGGGAAATVTTAAGTSTAAGTAGAAVATVAATSVSGAGLSAVVVSLIATTTIAGGAMLPVDRPPHVTESQQAAQLDSTFGATASPHVALDIVPAETPVALVAEVAPVEESPPVAVEEPVAGAETAPPQEVDAPWEDVPSSDLDGPPAPVNPSGRAIPEVPRAPKVTVAATADPVVPAQDAVSPPEAAGTTSPGKVARTRVDGPPQHAAVIGKTERGNQGRPTAVGDAPAEAAVKADRGGAARGREADPRTDLAAAGITSVAFQSAAIVVSSQTPPGLDQRSASRDSRGATESQRPGRAADGPPAHAAAGNGNAGGSGNAANNGHAVSNGHADDGSGPGNKGNGGSEQGNKGGGKNNARGK